MRISVTSVYVDDQSAALVFYTEILGFEKRTQEPVGEDSWLTVASPDRPDGPELLLEPAHHPAVALYRNALRIDGIPAAQFAVDDVASEHRRLLEHGVEFTQEPTHLGATITAVFDDTCGNLIQIVEQLGN